jgi:hypothetical protein
MEQDTTSAPVSKSSSNVNILRAEINNTYGVNISQESFEMQSSLYFAEIR